VTPRGLALLAALAACARHPDPALVTSGALENQQVRAVMDAALRADAAGQPADSLYLVGAATVADGVSQSAPARFAGVRPGGTAAISAMTIEVTPAFAWGVMEYRWLPAGGAPAAYGRATFVLERVGGRWRIKHVHTSSLRGDGRD
jgi:hypothetical protein